MYDPQRRYRPRLSTAVLIAAVLPLFPTDLPAISRRHDVPDERYREKARDYPEVGRFSFGSDKDFGSAVLIAPQWILLASHNLIFQQGPLAVEFGDSRYEVDWHVRHFAELPQPNSAHFTLDIALCHLARPVKDVVPAVLYERQDEVGKEVTIVGFGVPGDGLNGVPTNGLSGKKRTCTNIIDAVGTFDETPTQQSDGTLLFYDFDGPESESEHVNWFEGDSKPLPLEGMMTSGDSGGGVFIETPAGRRLIGINSGCFGKDGTVTGTAGKNHRYGIGSRTMRVSAFVPWIHQTIRHYESGAEPLTGLVAHWSFDEPSGEYVNDVSGIGHRGTIVRARRTRGIKAGALQFHSGPKTFMLPMEQQEYVQVANPTGLFYKIGRGICQDLKITGDITIAAWVCRSRSGGATGRATTDVDTIVSKTDPARKNPTDFAFVIWERSLRLYRGDRQFAESERISELAEYGIWQHVAATRKGKTVTFYRNGECAGTTTLEGDFTSSDNALIIGNSGAASMDFSGKLDELRVYNRELDFEEIRKLVQWDRSKGPSK